MLKQRLVVLGNENKLLHSQNTSLKSKLASMKSSAVVSQIESSQRSQEHTGHQNSTVTEVAASGTETSNKDKQQSSK